MLQNFVLNPAPDLSTYTLVLYLPNLDLGAVLQNVAELCLIQHRTSTYLVPLALDKYPVIICVLEMADVTVARYSFEGEKFEILVKPDPALDYRLGRRKDFSAVLISDEIYSDSGKGTKPSSEKLLNAFKTDDTAEIAKIILQKGDLNLTTDQRRRMIDEKRKQIIAFIAKTFVDPRTHLPHPPLRIEQAMKESRVSVDPQRGVDEQVKIIVERLRSIIALKSESLRLEILIPAQYASQSYAVLKSVGSLQKEEWQNNGSLKAILEIPAGARPNVIDRLGSITRGSATIEVI